MMLLKLCPRLDRRRFAVTVISLSDQGTVGPRLQALGIPVYALGVRSNRPSIAGWARLRRLLNELRPSLLQGWMYHGNLAATLTASGMPVVWGVRQSLYDLRKERLLTRAVIRASALLSARPAAILYNSRASAAQHTSFGFKNEAASIIPNGFDTEVFRPDRSARQRVRNELGLGEDALLIGMFGRYHPMKDHRTFLTAARMLADECPSAHFLLVGTAVDDANAELAGLLANTGIRRRVFLLGERADMPQLTAALDIAVSSSAWGEGFANVVGEAMSCGVPCVVTDVGDSAWIVGTTGRVVSPGEPQAMAQECHKLIQLPAQERCDLGYRARRKILEEFSLNIVVQQYEQLYARLIAHARS
jgi:glycosyltransferase involved in cell wall biosynthesis